VNHIITIEKKREERKFIHLEVGIWYTQRNEDTDASNRTRQRKQNINEKNHSATFFL
jgi:hypothetical protein